MTELEEYFDYLDGLRQSGVTNMYGAAPYLESEFNMTRKESSQIVSLWMKTFNRDKTVSERATNALQIEKSQLK